MIEIVDSYDISIVVLDNHTTKSEFLGENEFGYPEFNTERTELGEAIFNLKYRADEKRIDFIVDRLLKHLDSRNIKNEINFIVPAPYTNNINRIIQPVFAISKRLSQKSNITYKEVLIKTSPIQAKDRPVNINDIECNINNLCGNILLIDDIYSSGNTINICIEKLKKANSKISKIYAICITKTKPKK